MKVSEGNENMITEQRLVDVLSKNDSELFRNVVFSDIFESKKKYKFAFVALTSCCVLPFVTVVSKGSSDVCEGVSNALSKRFGDVGYIIRVFKDRFYIKKKCSDLFVLEPISSAEVTTSSYRVYIWRSDFGRLEPVSIDVVEQIICDENDSEFNQEEYDKISICLTRAGSEPLESSNGHQHFVKKGNEWIPVFPQDPDKVFRFALFGGFVGAHRFYMKMYGAGILYMLTFGLAGVGWFFDCLEMLLGCWKKKGNQLAPLQNKKKPILQFVSVFGVLILLFIVSSI